MRSSASPCRQKSSRRASKLQRSCRWLKRTPSMSKGVAANRSATAATSEGATNRNCAAGSMKRRISQGQAIRSILGRWRVTQKRPSGNMARGIIGSPAASQASAPPSSTSACQPMQRNSAAAPSESLRPLAQTTMAWPGGSDRVARRSCGIRRLVGTSRGRASRSSGRRTSKTTGASGRPIRRRAWAGVIRPKLGIGASLHQRSGMRRLGRSLTGGSRPPWRKG